MRVNQFVLVLLLIFFLLPMAMLGDGISNIPANRLISNSLYSVGSLGGLANTGSASSIANGSLGWISVSSSRALALHPPVPASEGGSVPSTSIELLAAAVCLGVGARFKIIRLAL
ncbi:MAG TPA: hypothetical protein VGX94_04925 [Terriglobia bacterium]|nr:hypothetical protein [Terriglobia bacterium]